MTAGTGHAACPRSPAPRVAPEFLVIVARDHPELFPLTRRQFLEDARVQVILDRRQLEGRHKAATEAPDRRSPDRRRAPDYWEDLRHHPVVLIPAARGVPIDTGVHSSPAPATPGSPMEIADGVTRVHEEIDQLCRRLCQWVGTGQKLLGRLAPRLVELRRDLEERDNELMRLRAEVEHLTRERAAIAEAVGAAMRTIDRLDVLGRQARGSDR